MFIGLVVNSNALDCLRAASLALVNLVLAVFRVDEIVTVFFKIPLRLPVWALLGDCFLTVFFLAGLRGIRLIGEMLGDEIDVGLVEGPGLSVGVDVPCSGVVRVTNDGAVQGPGAPVSWDRAASDRAFALACILSAKRNFSILLLFLLYSPKVLQATKFIYLS